MAQKVHNHNVAELCMGMKRVNLRVIVLHVGTVFLSLSVIQNLDPILTVILSNV